MTVRPPTPPVQSSVGSSGYDLTPVEDYIPLGSSSSNGSPASEARSTLEAAAISTLERKIAILTKKINIKSQYARSGRPRLLDDTGGRMLDGQAEPFDQTPRLEAVTIHSVVIRPSQSRGRGDGPARPASLTCSPCKTSHAHIAQPITLAVIFIRNDS
jgi:hypothetical protein